MDYTAKPYFSGAPPFPGLGAERTYVQLEQTEYIPPLRTEWVERDHTWISPRLGDNWNLDTLKRRAYEMLLPANQIGYPSYFIGDGYVVCVACGIKSLLDEPDGDEIDYIVDYDSAYQYAGLTCDVCQRYIIEPHCRECGRDESELDRPLYSDLSGELRICRDCILAGWERANMIADRKAAYNMIFTDLLDVGVYEVGRYDYPYRDGQPQHYRSHIYGDPLRVWDYHQARRREARTQPS